MSFIRNGKRVVFLGLALFLSSCGSSTKTAVKDQYLEEVRGEKALAFVNRHNERTAATLEKDPRYEPLRSQLLSIYNSKDKLTGMTVRLQYVYDFWKDDKNPRGIFRRTLVKDYLAGKRKWDVILDVDKLAKDENQNWVYGWHQQFKDRFLFSFSIGGGDAKVTREFDLKTRKWVKDGFNLPLAKNQISWVDENSVLVGLASDPAELTKSGYPMTVRLWKRGEDLKKVPIVFRGESTDTSASSYANRYKIDGPVQQMVYSRSLDFYNYQTTIEFGGRTYVMDIPSDSWPYIMDDYIYLNLKSDWNYKTTPLKSGSLVRFKLNEFLEKKAEVEVLFLPTTEVALQSYELVRDRIFLALMDNAKDKFVELKKAKSGWIQKALPLPSNSSIDVVTSSDENALLVLEVETFINTLTRYLFDLRKNKLSKIENGVVRFDPAPFKVEQKFATSKDGTRIPYYLVSRKDLKLNGQNPTIVNAYGGFRSSVKPYYASTTGLAWLEKGGVFVMANIRGGGEYGPTWHSTAIKENRQRVYDDLFAVTEDLQKSGVTSPARTGAYGGSNGGLLMGVALTQRPELYNAIAIQVPLLDMLRYHQLPPGDSWTAEYGNPDDPAMYKVISKYSPYQNLKPGVKYPESFLMTSTADDRVHPSHARRMAAKMEEFGVPFLYYENTEGGHAASVNYDQTAKWYALQYIYFQRKLMDHQ